MAEFSIWTEIYNKSGCLGWSRWLTLPTNAVLVRCESGRYVRNNDSDLPRKCIKTKQDPKLGDPWFFREHPCSWDVVHEQAINPGPGHPRLRH